MFNRSGKTKRKTPAPEAEPNETYLALSSSFRGFKYITLLVFVIFTVAMISIFRSDITAENFRYLMRYMNTTALEYTGDYRTIYYDPNDTNDIELFNNDIAVLKNDSLDLFDMQGNSTMNYDMSYSDSMMVSAGKYILTYDMGEGKYNIFNNFTSLNTESFDYPITCAAIAPNGTYAVVTRDIQFRSLIKIYDSHFRLLTNIYKDKYVMDIELNEGGDELLILSSYAKDGDFSTEIMTYSPYSEEPNGTASVDGVMGVSCGYHDDGSYTVLCDSKLLFFDKNDKQVGEYDLGTIVPTKCTYTDKYTVMTYDRNIVGQASVMMIFDTDGKEVTSTVIKEKITSMKYYDGCVYILSEDKLYRFFPDRKLFECCEIENGSTKLFIYDRNTALITYNGRIEVCSLKDMFTVEDDAGASDLNTGNESGNNTVGSE